VRESLSTDIQSHVEVQIKRIDDDRARKVRSALKVADTSLCSPRSGAAGYIRETQAWSREESHG